MHSAHDFIMSQALIRAHHLISCCGQISTVGTPTCWPGAQHSQGGDDVAEPMTFNYRPSTVRHCQQGTAGSHAMEPILLWWAFPDRDGSEIIIHIRKRMTQAQKIHRSLTAGLVAAFSVVGHCHSAMAPAPLRLGL